LESLVVALADGGELDGFVGGGDVVGREEIDEGAFGSSDLDGEVLLGDF